jgi:ferric-dicitrate binding protein FerR (iron transport regulator)
MKDFRLYQVADFAMDEDFIRWVQAPDEADSQFWQQWLEQNPAKQLVVAEARSMVTSVHLQAPFIPAAVIEAEINKLLLHIREEKRVPVKPVFAITKTGWYAAACLVALFFCISLLLTKKASVEFPAAYGKLVDSLHLRKHVNTTDSTILLSLADGSTVALSPESSISYAPDFGKTATRDVYLSGEAFFQVAKNPNAPFKVFANEITTKVLGTSFTVRSFAKDATIKVAVHTGKVSVYKQLETAPGSAQQTHTPGGIIVSCNQQLFFEKKQQKFDKLLFDNPVPVTAGPPQHSQLYENAQLHQVFCDLSKDYGIYIMFDAELLKNCTINADLDNEPFYQKLNMICKAIGASYEVIDGQVVIQSGGCK